MSVYIKGNAFYKPTACAPCKIRQWCQLWRQVTLPAHITHPKCPIIEVQPHGRLIEESEVKNKIANRIYDDGFSRGWNAAMKQILEAMEDAPTVIPASKEE